MIGPVDVQGDRPLPVLTDRNRPFWQAAARDEFILPRCTACGRVYFPIAPVCPDCGAGDPGWRHSKGLGTVSSFVVFHQAFFESFSDRVPYVVAQVALDEGPRYTANLLGISPDAVRAGLPVRVAFERITDTITLPQFRPRD